MQNAHDFYQILRTELESRTQRNPKYSLRAFARDLGLSAPRLSRILNGERGMSKDAAEQVAVKLNFNSQEKTYFVNLVEFKHARSKKAKASAQVNLGKASAQYQVVSLDKFRIISEWYHLAILSLLETKTAQSETAWIAKRLGISVLQAEQGIQRLLDQGMLERQKKNLVVTGTFFVDPKEIPSQSVRSFHDQVLQKARDALATQATTERDFTSLVIATDPDNMAEVKLFIKNFREEFERKFCQKSKKKTEVMALGIQFFRMSEKEGESA